MRFPALISLELTCVGLKSLTFTEHNTPLLEELTLSNVQGECCPFHLALPQLRVLDAEHTMLGERPIDEGQFGLSLSRCPRLEAVRSYKFRCLGDCNYAVLPSLTSLLLHRSECTTHLDILYAPELYGNLLSSSFMHWITRLAVAPPSAAGALAACAACRLGLPRAVCHTVCALCWAGRGAERPRARAPRAHVKKPCSQSYLAIYLVSYLVLP